MAMPDYEPNQKWPPAPYDQSNHDIEVWRAWWAGDVEKLTEHYSTAVIHTRPGNAQLLGEGRDRYFWGRSNEQGANRRHVPMPAAVTSAVADLLFSKPPRITPGPDDEKNKELAARMDKIFGAKSYAATLSEAAELQSYSGSIFLRPWWDSSLTDHVVPSHVPADRAVPEFRHSYLTAVTFWNIVSTPDETPIIRHLERHEPGKIIHRLYEGTQDTLGERIDLSEHPATAWLTEEESGATKDGVVHTGLDEIDVVHIPNVLPARRWHGINGLSQLGRSDFEGIESSFDELDETWSSWLRDVEDGKSRLFIEEDALIDLGPGRGGAFDQERHLYTKTQAPLGTAADSGGQQIDQIKFDIRYQEHAETMAEVRAHIMEHVGLSQRFFNDNLLSPGITATQVNSENAKSESTRAKRINFWNDGLTRFVQIVMKLDAIHFDTGLTLTDPPEVHFAANLVETEGERMQSAGMAVSQKVLSRRRAVERINPDWTKQQIDDELEEINNDAIQDAKLMFGQGLAPEDAAEANEGMEQIEDALQLEEPEQKEPPADDLAAGWQED